MSEPRIVPCSRCGEGIYWIGGGTHARCLACRGVTEPRKRAVVKHVPIPVPIPIPDTGGDGHPMCMDCARVYVQREGNRCKECAREYIRIKKRIERDATKVSRKCIDCGTQVKRKGRCTVCGTKYHIQRMRQIRKEKAARGECQTIRCLSRVAVHGDRLCPICRERARASARQRRKQGECVRCKRKLKDGSTTCEACREYHREYGSKRNRSSSPSKGYAKKKALEPTSKKSAL